MGKVNDVTEECFVRVARGQTYAEIAVHFGGKDREFIRQRVLKMLRILDHNYAEQDPNVLWPGWFGDRPITVPKWIQSHQSLYLKRLDQFRLARDKREREMASQ